MRDFQGFTQNPNSRRQRRWIGFLVVALVLLTGAGLTAVFPPFAGEGNLSGKADRGTPGIFETLSNVSDDPQNILVVGVDERPEVEGSRTDTMMLVRVYPETGEVKIVSVPRDLLVEVEPGAEGKINAAYSYDGISGAVEAVENFSNVYVDHYAVVDFAGFEAMVDAIGGLQIDVEEGQVPPGWQIEEGVQRLGGHRALVYARYRNTSGGDLDRIQRQQEVLAALRSKALRWRTAKRFPQITRAVAENVETDMSLLELASLGRAMSKHGRNGLMTSTQLEGTPETLEDGSKVLLPDEAANERILREFRE